MVLLLPADPVPWLFALRTKAYKDSIVLVAMTMTHAATLPEESNLRSPSFLQGLPQKVMRDLLRQDELKVANPCL